MRLRRAHVIVVTLLTLLLLVAALIIVLGGDNNQEGKVSPTPTGTAAPSVSPSRPTPSAGAPEAFPFALGVSENLADLSPANRTTRVAELKAAGVTWRRVDVRNDTAEKVPGKYDYSRTEPTMAAVGAAGIDQVAIATYVPSHLAGPGQTNCGGDNRCSPDDTPRAIAGYANFVGDMAKHYCDERFRVRVIEIWNEPNLSKYWPKPNPELYVKLLKAAYRAVEANCSRMIVLLGGLGDAKPDCADCISAVNFLEAVYRHGGRGHFDAVSSHAYPSAPGQLSRQPFDLHEIMERHGDGHKQVWVTEFALDTTDLRAKASTLRAMVTELRPHRSKFGPLFWLSFRDTPGDDKNMGLTDATGKDRLAVNEFRRLADSTG